MKSQWKARFRIWLPVVLIFLVHWAAYARVGGGEHYSSDRPTGGAEGGRSSEADLILALRIAHDIGEPLIRFFFWFHRHHLVAALILDAVIAYILYFLFTGVRSKAGDRLAGRSLSGGAAYSPELARSAHAQRQLERLREQFDPDFSPVLFRDFCYALYSTAHQARGERKLGLYAPYFSAEAVIALQDLSKGVLQKVSGIIIGSMQIQAVSLPERSDDGDIHVDVVFESNSMETLTGGRTETWYSVERWRLQRSKRARSRPPDRIRTIACPNCGAPPSKMDRGPCPSCGVVVKSGDFDWFVESVRVQRTSRPPLLTSQVEEQGTDLPTHYDSDLRAGLRAYEAKEPAFSLSAFENRVRFVFTELQKAWTERKWELARPFESDQMFQAHCYWIAEYKKQRLVNVLDQVRITRVIPVKMVQDHYFSSLTVRIYASMIDYTRNEDGQVVSGSPRIARSFSEYWTFIRGSSAKAPKGSNRECPQCGAELKINMAGHCEFCAAKVTAGDFDWVLSQIEQDEAYVG